MKETLAEAISYAATIIRDDEVKLALASHLTVSEMEAIAGIFEADGDYALADELMHFMIHGDFEVYAVVTDLTIGPLPMIRLDYYDGCDRLFFSKIHHATLDEVCTELMLDIDADTQGRITVASRIAGKV